MAFEKLAAHIDFIEEKLKKKMSPRAIAEALGEPGLYQSIRRYKIAVFDLNKEANAAWKEERAKTHEARLKEGRAPIVDSLEVINLGKLRAKQLLGLELQQEYETAEGEKRKLSWGSAAIYWQAGQKMICELSRAESEIAGDLKPEVNVTIQNEIKLDDILKEYYGSEDAPGSQDSESNCAGESLHPTQANSEAGPIPDQPQT